MNDDVDTTTDPRKASPRLEMRRINKSFASIPALKNVSFSAYGGELHALMGENGAGKSTLMKILAGAHRADAGGEILIDGVPVAIGSPYMARSRGISVIYQELSLAPNLTVAENLFLGREMKRLALVDRRGMAAATQPILDRLHASFTPQTPVHALSLGERQLVEIARALAVQSRILIMDEPTTSLTSRETERLFRIIQDLKAEGIAIIYISHRMEEVYQLADRVSVLRDGACVGTLMRAKIEADLLVSMMVGRDLTSFYKKEHSTAEVGAVALSVRGLTDGKRVHGCSFDVRRGEVLGIAGLVGVGRTEIARLIIGADPHVAGQIFLDGRPTEIRSPREAIRAGIAYLTEDRAGLGLFLDMTVQENVNLSVVGNDAYPGGFTNFRAARRRANAAMRTFAIRASSTSATAGGLSGGNQQKVLLARLLETEPRVLILDEPTRGVDVGAKSEIYRLIDELARRGVAIIVISSELPEIIGISDRVVVMHAGRMIGEIAAAPGNPITQEAIMLLSTGVAA
jgi:ribose transport system ATP-binding protein